MDQSFKTNLRKKSSEQLLNMISNKGTWSNDQLILIIEELENRDLINDEIQEIKDEIDSRSIIERIDFDNPKNEFEEDLAILMANDEKRIVKEKYQTIALATLVGQAFFFGILLFNIPAIFQLDSQFTEDLVYIFWEFNYVFILLFLINFGFFIGRLFLVSIVLSIINALTLGLLFLLFGWS